MHLQEESYYADNYDLWTIRDCLRAIDFWNTKAANKLPDDKKAQIVHLGLNSELYWIKGERYKERSSAIREWMEKDRRRDERVENAKEPQNIRCAHCYEKMHCTLKDLYDFPDEPVAVLFFFECSSCKKRRGIFDDGREYVSKPDYCPKCKKEIKASHTKNGNVITTIKKCSCGFTETEVEDWDQKDIKRKEKKRQEKELLTKHRSEFCLSDKEGYEYLESVRRLEGLKDLLTRVAERNTDPDYKKVDQLRKLKVLELEKLLAETLEKEKYIKLAFEKPVIDKHIIVPFSIQDADPSRQEKDSIYKLQRFIKKTLKGTNWRLMSEGINCRLGFLSGRLKGYEQEEDLLKIIKSKE